MRWWLLPLIFSIAYLAGAAVVVVATDGPKLQALGTVGDGLAPFGTALVLAGLMFAFEQQREDRKRAHTDRLANGYARWIPIARWKLREAARLAFEARARSQDARTPTLQGRPNLFAIPPLLQEIRIEATEIQLFEDNPTYRDRVQKLIAFTKPLPHGVGGRWHPFVVDFHVYLLGKQRELEQLMADLSVRLRGGTAEPIPIPDEPAPAEPEATEPAPEPPAGAE